MTVQCTSHLLLISALLTLGCGAVPEEPNFDYDTDDAGDGDTDTGTASDGDGDSDADADNDADSDIDSDSDIDTDSDTDTLSPCQKAQLTEPLYVCCPKQPPATCSQADWSGFSDEGPLFGCCTADLTAAVRCEQDQDEPFQEACDVPCAYNEIPTWDRFFMGCQLNTCNNPFQITGSVEDWQRPWEEFIDTFSAESTQDCGEGGSRQSDIWFTVRIAPRTQVTVQEKSERGRVIIRLVQNCETRRCEAYDNSDPASLEIANEGYSDPVLWHVVITQSTENDDDGVLLDFVYSSV